MTGVEVETLAGQQGSVQLLLALEDAGAVSLTSLALTDPGMDFDEYEGLGTFLGMMKRATSWWLGDWLNFGEGTYGERFAQAVHATKLNEQTLLHYQFVCREVAASRRAPGLAFGAHALVARLDPKEQTYWIKQAVRKGWGERELRDAMKAKRKDTAPTLPDMEEGTTRSVLEEVAHAILRDAVPHIDAQHYLIPNEDVARLRAALGEEE